MSFFRLYPYVGPALLLPCSYGLWLERYAGDHRMVLFSLSLPIAFAYIVPGLGTNWLRLWEIAAGYRWGRFRPHHGLVFGAATSWLAWLTLPFPGQAGWLATLRAGFVLGSVVAFWNWLYDAYAIKAGYIKVYTRKYYEGAGPEAIATDYAPAVFGVFGCCYGIALRAAEQLLMTGGRWDRMWSLLGLCQLGCLTLPVLAYVFLSFLRAGESGLRSYERVGHEV